MKENDLSNSLAFTGQHKNKKGVIKRKLGNNQEEEKSLLLEGTWNMGKCDYKQMELDLKLELKNRGLLKSEFNKAMISKNFPSLNSYKKTKIEKRIEYLQRK